MYHASLGLKSLKNWNFKPLCYFGCSVMFTIFRLSVILPSIYLATFCLFLARRRLMGELIVYQSLQRLSVNVFKHLLWNHWANFIWRLLRTREQKFVQMVLVTWPRWPPRPFMVKTLLQNQKADDLWTWYVAMGMWGLPSLFKWWST